eukprot:gene20079-26075_t
MYWWIKIKDGIRYNLTEPISINSNNSIDPRLYTITSDDIDCTLK